MHERKPPAYCWRVSIIESLKRLLPGIFLCIAITLAALLLERMEIFLIDQRYLEALVLALLLGVVVRTVWKPGRSGTTASTSAQNLCSNSRSSYWGLR